MSDFKYFVKKNIMTVEKYKQLKTFLFLFLLSLQSLVAQTQHRPKIGLALSGGGAKGMAHIGVLKVLEEIGIVPDYITGVSMGSIVGGLYACGYSADSIEKIFIAQDWNQMLSDKIFESDIFFDEKKVFRNELMEFAFKNKKITPPGGLVQGQHITEMMNYFTFPFAHIQNFDSLPIPFLTLATDIETCKPTLIKHGNLSEAMRASMAVPLAFAPVEINNLLFVDGGMTRNFAVEELKKMGADIIIGCYTGRNLYKKDRLKSATNIAAQIASFSGYYDAKNQIHLIDVYIEPEFGKLNASDFNKTKEMVKVGYDETLKHKDSLKKIAEIVTPKKLKKIKELKNIIIDSIKIIGNKTVSSKQILANIALERGDIVNRDLLKEKIKNLYGLFLFKKIGYKLEAKKNGKYNLILICNEKNKNNINASIHFDTYSNFGVNVNYINRNLLFAKSRLLVEAYFSKYFKARANYTLYFGKNNFFNTKIGFEFENSKIPALLLDREVSRYDNRDFNLFVAFNFTPIYNQNISFKSNIERIVFNSALNIPEKIKRVIYKNFMLNLTYDFNNLDNYYFPKKGFDLSFKTSYGIPIAFKYDYKNDSLDKVFPRPSLESFYQIMFRGRSFFSVKKITLEGRLNLFFSSQNSLINSYALIGGVENLNRHTLPFWGFHANEFVTQNAIGIGGSLRYSLIKKIQAGLHFDFYLIENLNQLQIREDIGFGTGIDIGYNSRIGPIKIGLMNGTYFKESSFNNLKFYLSIGFFL